MAARRQRDLMASLVLAMLAALGYGSGDFAAGLAARRASALSVNPIVFAAAAITVAAVMPWTHLVAPSPAAVGWGVASGAGNGAGAAALLAGFRRAPFSIAGPLSSVVGAGLAVLVGIALGNRPTAVCWAGLLLAVPAIMAVASSTGEHGQDRTTRRAGRAAVYFGLAAGAGSAMSLIGLARASTTAGIWPVLAAQASAFATTLVFAATVTTTVILTRRNATAAPAGSPQPGAGQGQGYFTAARTRARQAAARHDLLADVKPAPIIHDLLADVKPAPIISAGASQAGRSSDEYLRSDQPHAGAPALPARSSGEQMTTPLQAWPLAVTSGALTGLAEMSFFFAAHTGTLAVSAVITSLFPAITVSMAVLFTGERLGTIRLAGLGLAVVSVSLIAMGGSVVGGPAAKLLHGADFAFCAAFAAAGVLYYFLRRRR